MDNVINNNLPKYIHLIRMKFQYQIYYFIMNTIANVCVYFYVSKYNMIELRQSALHIYTYKTE